MPTSKTRPSDPVENHRQLSERKNTSLYAHQNDKKLKLILLKVFHNFHKIILLLNLGCFYLFFIDITFFLYGSAPRYCWVSVIS